MKTSLRLLGRVSKINKSGGIIVKALIKPDHGKGMELREVSRPQVQPDEVLVKVQAASICGSDLHMYEGTFGYSWINVPLVPGHEFAGTIEEVGSMVDMELLGKRVLVNPYIACGSCAACRRGQPNLCDGSGSPMKKIPARSLSYGFRRDGGMAEYAAVNKDNVLILPDDCPMEIAGMLEAIGVSLHAIERSGIKPGDSAVVIGPGPIGLALVAILRNYGLKKLIVSGLQADMERLQLAGELGATDIIHADLVKEGEEVSRLTDGAGVNYVFEASGFSGGINSGIHMLRKGGELLLVGIATSESTILTNEIVRGEITVKGVYGVTPQTLARTVAMASSGKYDFSKLISHVLPLTEAVKGFEFGLQKKGAKVILKP